MKLVPLSGRCRSAAIAALLFVAATEAEAQSGASGPLVPGTNPAAAAGPAAPAAAALPHGAGPTTSATAEEAAVLNLIGGIQANAPDYGALAPALAQALRLRLAVLNARLAPLGPVEGIELLGDNPEGMKRFRVRFETRSSEWALALDRNGKVSALSVSDPPFASRAAVPQRVPRRPAKRRR